MTADDEMVAEHFARLFPDGIDRDRFSVDGFCADTDDLGGECAERLRQLAIWHSVEFPATSLADWPLLEHLFDRAAALDPDSVDILHSKGIAALELARLLDAPEDAGQMFGVAREALREARAMEPTSADVLHTLGLACYFDADCPVDEAEGWFRQAASADPDMARARLYLAHCLQDRNEWQAALATYDQLDLSQLRRELQPWHVNRVKEQRGLCLMKLGRAQQALTLLTELLERYEAAEEDELPDDLIEFPSQLVEAATTGLREALAERVARMLKRHGWYSFYAAQFDAEPETEPD